MKKTIILAAAAILGVFCFEARADRTVHAVVPIRAKNVDGTDQLFWISLHNPSQFSQTVTLTATATGDYYFSNKTNGATQISGTNLWSCNLPFHATTADGDTQIKSCSITNTVMGSGQNREVLLRVRRSNSGSENTPFPVNQGVSVKITVAGDDGFIIAAGGTFIESAAGVAYTGGPFTINGGRPF